MFWRWNVIKICVMTSRSYVGKMNSTLGSVVPLAMFSKRKVIFNIIESLILSSVCCCSLTNWLERCITEASRTWKTILCFWDPSQWDKFFFSIKESYFIEQPLKSVIDRSMTVWAETMVQPAPLQSVIDWSMTLCLWTSALWPCVIDCGQWQCGHKLALKKCHWLDVYYTILY